MYKVNDGTICQTLKEVRQHLGVSGRAIKHLFENGTIIKIK